MNKKTFRTHNIISKRYLGLYVFLISIGFAILASVGATYLTNLREGGDGWWELATNIHNYGQYSFIKDKPFTTFRPPLYPALLVACLTTGFPLLSITILQILMFSFSSYLIFSAAKLISDNQIQGISTWLIWLTYPYSYLQIHYVKINILETLIISLVLWSLIKILKCPTDTLGWIYFGFAGAASLLSYTMIFIFYAAVFILIIFYFMIKKRSIKISRHALIAFLVTIIVYLPWGLFVFIKSGGKALISADPIGFNYFVGNEYANNASLRIYNQGTLGHEYVLNKVEEAGGNRDDQYWQLEPSIHKELNRMMLQDAIKRPLNLIKKVSTQVFMLWYSSQKNNFIVKIAALWTFLLFLLFIVGAIKRPTAPNIVLLISIILITFLYGLTYAYVRYAQPFVYLLCFVIGDWVMSTKTLQNLSLQSFKICNKNND